MKIEITEAVRDQTIKTLQLGLSYIVEALRQYELRPGTKKVYEEDIEKTFEIIRKLQKQET